MYIYINISIFIVVYSSMCNALPSSTGVSACVCACACVCVMHYQVCGYGVATVNRINKIIGLFCRIASLLEVFLAKETYHLIDPTNQSHPIVHHCITKYVGMGWLR